MSLTLRVSGATGTGWPFLSSTECAVSEGRQWRPHEEDAEAAAGAKERTGVGALAGPGGVPQSKLEIVLKLCAFLVSELQTDDDAT